MKAIINPDGVTCTTVNPLGESAFLPGHLYPQSMSFQIKRQAEWQQAEADRKTYEIEYVVCQGVHYEGNYCEDGIILQPGTVHEIEVINDKAIIK